MTGLDRYLLDPRLDHGRCQSRLHRVRGVDHAKPIRLSDGTIAHVCVFCWHSAELGLMRRHGKKEGQINAHQRVQATRRAKLILDEVAIARVVAGGASYKILTAREQQTAVKIMTARGLSAAEIGAFTGMHPRIAQRFRNGPPAGSTLMPWERRLVAELLPDHTAAPVGLPVGLHAVAA